MKRTVLMRIIRWTILILVLILTTVLGRLHQIIKIYPPVDAFCPFGGVESFWALVMYQGLLKRVAWSSFILLFATLGTAVLFRRSFCGNICPLGFLQELFGLGGRRLLKRRFELPARLDKILRYLKYPVLILFTGLAWKTFNMVIRPYDPWVAYQHIGSPELWSEYLVGAVILGASLLGGIFLDRPFCRYLCPMGGFLALPSKIGLTRVRRNEETCIDCGACDYACPVALKVSASVQVLSSECLACGECVQACPVPDTLSFTLPGKKGRKIPALVVILGTLAVFASVLGFTTWNKSFVWKTETGLERTAEKLLWGPQRISGENTLLEIVQIYRIPPELLAGEFGIVSEDVFYQPLSEAGIDPAAVETLVNRLYSEAGLDPKNLLGGGGGGNHGEGE